MASATDLIVKKEVSVVGVTFLNDDGTDRQALLQEITEEHGEDLFLAEIDLQEFEYNGAPAYHVVIDDKIVGCLSADLAASLKKIEQEQGYTFWAENGTIVGGGIAEYGWNDNSEDAIQRQLKYGVRLTLCLASPYAQAQISNQTKKKLETAKVAKKSQPHVPVKSPSSNKKKSHLWKLIVAILFLSNGLRMLPDIIILAIANWSVSIMFFYWWNKSRKKENVKSEVQKESKSPNSVSQTSDSSLAKKEPIKDTPTSLAQKKPLSKYEHHQISLVDISQKNEDGTERQKILWKMRFKKYPYDTDYDVQMLQIEGTDHIEIAIDVAGNRIGMLPQDKTNYFIENWHRMDGVTWIDVTSGGRDHGQPVNFSAKVTIRLRNE